MHSTHLTVDARRRVSTVAGKGGFSLMEVTLAIFVVGVGVISLFALISGGLNYSNRAVADTHAASFADTVFNSLRYRSMLHAEKGSASWNGFWTTFESGATNLYIDCFTAWEKSQSQYLKISAQKLGGISSLEFKNADAGNQVHGSPAKASLENHTLRYTLTIVPLKSITTNYAATLKVWDGKFGSTADKDALTFYTEFNNPGDL